MAAMRATDRAEPATYAGLGRVTANAPDARMGHRDDTAQACVPVLRCQPSACGERYPPLARCPRPVLIGGLGVVAAIALGWLIWAALFHSRPAVDAQVAAYTVISDTAIDVTLTVERPRPGRPVTCRVVAQAADFQPVGEQQVAVEASTASVVDKRVMLVTTAGGPPPRRSQRLLDSSA